MFVVTAILALAACSAPAPTPTPTPAPVPVPQPMVSTGTGEILPCDTYSGVWKAAAPPGQYRVRVDTVRESSSFWPYIAVYEVNPFPTTPGASIPVSSLTQIAFKYGDAPCPDTSDFCPRVNYTTSEDAVMIVVGALSCNGLGGEYTIRVNETNLSFWDDYVWQLEDTGFF